MNFIQKTSSFLSLIVISSIAIAQTAGSGTLSTIESLAKKEAENSNAMGELNRKHMDSYVSEDIKAKRLQNELSELERKKAENVEEVKRKLQNKLDEIENGSTWINRRKSARKGWKEYNPGTCSAGGPPPICTADHWYSVSVSEAMREYDALVQKELNKIRNEENKYDQDVENKKSEISDFQDGDNEFSELRDKLNKKMNEILAENSDIRKRIAELSKIYVDQIEKEIKIIQNNDIRAVISEIAQKHYSIIKLGVLETQLLELEKAEKKALYDLNEKIRKQNDQKIADIQKLIVLKQDDLNAFRSKTNSLVFTYNQEIGILRREDFGIGKLLEKKDALSTEELEKLLKRQVEVRELIKSFETKITQADADFKEFSIRIESELNAYKNDIWNLQVNLPTVIRNAEDNLKEAYTAKKEIINDAIAGRKAKQISTETAIAVKKSEFRNKAKEYEKIVEPERIRLMQACKESGSSCWGSDVVSKIWGNANKLIDCAQDIENNNVLYSGCEEVNSYYLTLFRSVRDGISDEDLGKLQRSNPSYEYQKLIDKL